MVGPGLDVYLRVQLDSATNQGDPVLQTARPVLQLLVTIPKEMASGGPQLWGVNFLPGLPQAISLARGSRRTSHQIKSALPSP